MAVRPAVHHRPCAASAEKFTEDYVYPVHLQDVNFRKLIMVCTLRYDHVLDVDKLCHGLTRLLEKGDWRKLGGRLRHSVSKHVQAVLRVHTVYYVIITKREPIRQMEASRFTSHNNIRPTGQPPRSPTIACRTYASENMRLLEASQFPQRGRLYSQISIISSI